MTQLPHPLTCNMFLNINGDANWLAQTFQCAFLRLLFEYACRFLVNNIIHYKQ